MPTLYLHIGTPKTATTFLQKFFETNGESLERRGFCYPLLPYSYPRVSARRNGHFLIGRVWREDGQPDIAEEERIWNEGIEKLLLIFQKYQNIILSDEGIWNAVAFQKNSRWKDLKKASEKYGFDIKIIVYLRRQDALAESTWNQRIKLAGEKRFSEMKWDAEKLKKTVALDYYGQLEKISEVYGRENLIVRIFEQEHFAGEQKNIQSDFLYLLGLKLEEDFVQEQPQTNLALKGNSHEIKRILNGLPHFDRETKSFVETTVRFLSDSSNRDYKYSMFSPQEREEFLAAYEQSNRQIVSEYFDGRLETLFSTDKEEKPKWTPDNPYMYEDIIKYFGEVSLIHQKNVIELQGQISKLEKAVLEVQKENISLKKRIDRISDTFRHPQKVFQYLRGRKKER